LPKSKSKSKGGKKSDEDDLGLDEDFKEFDMMGGGNDFDDDDDF
jgi:DNA-directed RNA polymerase subunit delta